MCAQLAGYAVTEDDSRGRLHAEPAHPYRSDFERDRDRIIHCSAFRRLEGKTQVFTPGLDDYYRTRLTHSIEVAQIARTIAKLLGLNETLTEAVCLAHDLGHSPFGHAGESALNDLMADFGGFEHNHQCLRIVDLLEHPYPEFAGLNLMYETRLAVAKHETPYDTPKDDNFAELNCSLEGQVAAVADRIAVNSHDLEDGMRAGILHADSLKAIKTFDEAQSRINARAIEDPSIRRTRIARTIIDILVSDCIDASENAIARANVRTVHDVYATKQNLILLSDESEPKLVQLQRFLMANLYRHKSLLETRARVTGWLKRLFESLCKQPHRMPRHFQRLSAEQGVERTVCDYIAGMTDRFCLNLLEK